MTKLTGTALDRAVANALGLKSVHDCEKWISAPIKNEGQPMPYGDNIDPNAVETTYIEFSLPVALEKECRAMIDAWFKAKEKNMTIQLATDDGDFYGLPRDSVSASNADGNGVTAGETAPVKEIDPNQWAFDRGLEST